VDTNWKIVQGSMWMYDFGSLREEAHEALGSKYGFTRQRYVGRPDPSVHYLSK